MTNHLIIIKTSLKDKIVKNISDVLEKKGCVISNNKEDSISFDFFDTENHVCIKTSDPFFNDTKLFSSPNDFFIPLSCTLESSWVIIFDINIGNIIQYWIFKDGSCIDQYHSNWKAFSLQEQEEITGNPDILSQLFPETDSTQWQIWLKSENNLNKVLDFLNLSNMPEWLLNEHVPLENSFRNLSFRLPHITKYTPKHFFPWVLLAAPAAYFSLRYKQNPTLSPASNTPLDNSDIFNSHKYLAENEFNYLGDYNIDVVSHTKTFLRLYFRPIDCIHVSISRIETPMDVSWFTEITTHFTDETRISTTNTVYDSPFNIPYQTIISRHDLKTTKELLDDHIENINKLQKNRSAKQYSEENYIDEFNKLIQYDFYFLEKNGYITKKSNDTYGPTWTGTFKMLYQQWKSALKE